MQNNLKMAGQKWTEIEIQELILEIKSGKSIQDIAKYHNRSQIAIQLRMANIIHEKLKKKQKQQVASELNLNLNSIDNILRNSEKYTSTKTQSLTTQPPQNHNINFTNKLNEMETKLNIIEKYCKSILKKLK